MGPAEYIDRHGEDPHAEPASEEEMETYWCDACSRWPAKVNFGPGCQLCRVCTDEAMGVIEAGGDPEEVLP